MNSYRTIYIEDFLDVTLLVAWHVLVIKYSTFKVVCVDTIKKLFFLTIRKLNVNSIYYM
jgi:hypothetical protein